MSHRQWQREEMAKIDAILRVACEGLSSLNLEILAVVSFDLAPVKVDVVNRNRPSLQLF